MTISYNKKKLRKTVDRGIKPEAHFQRVRDAENLIESESDKWALEGEGK